MLLALGVRFDDRTSSSWIPGYSFTIPPTRLIHVDIDPDEIGRNYPVALGLMADVRTFLRQVLAELDRARDLHEHAGARAKWLDTIDGYRKEWNAFIAPGFTDDATPIHPQRAAHEIDKALPEDAILVSDIGVHHNWLHPVLQAEAAGFADRLDGLRPDGLRRRRRAGRASSPRPTGPASRCAATARSSCMPTCSAPRSNTICRWSGWCGTTTPMPRSAACSAAISAAASSRPTSTIPRPAQPYNPDFAAMARSAGVEGVSVDRAGDLAEALRAGIAANRPYLIDANISADKNPGGAGVWELPGLGQSQPAFGGRYQP